MLEIGIALLPLLVLLASLLIGRYPGCEAIVRLSERLASRPRPRPVRRALRPRPFDAVAVRGGLLIALRIAKRPPPLAA